MSSVQSQSQPAVLESAAAMRAHLDPARQRGLRIGLVPTMGALHAGHVSLLTAARRECDVVAASIFVNPAQFGPHEDLDQYPRPLERDLAVCGEAGVDVVWTPPVAEVYPPGFCTFVEVAGLSDIWEGAVRPGHFRGVATVVLKLFEVCGPHVAYFGQKDFQQQAVIRRMVRDLNVPVELRVCPTAREPDGLALSSRNVYLTPEQRTAALALSRSLAAARRLVAGGKRDLAMVRAAMREVLAATPLVEVDYATVVHPDSLRELDAPEPGMAALVAARVGRTRLIDNCIFD